MQHCLKHWGLLGLLLGGWATTLTVAAQEPASNPPEVMAMVSSVPLTLLPEEQLVRLLQQRRQQPQRAAEIDAEIHDRFAVTRAIVVLDMVGFSRMTQEEGIIDTLEAIYRLREIALPTLGEHDGTVFKMEADNLYAVFATPDAALAATEQLLTRLHAADLHASIGIGYGEVLQVGDRDFYGDEMNLASKLGEDLAGPDDILLTAAAHAALSTPGGLFTPLTTDVSGVTVTLYQRQQLQ